MKVLIAIDGSSELSLAVDTAASLTWPGGSQIEVLTVLPTDAALQGWGWIDAGAMHVDELRQGIVAERATHLDDAVQALARPGIDVVTRIRVGRAASMIVQTANELDVDLIILGARGHGALERALLGSVSAEVVDQAHCGVLIARRGTAARLLIGTDGSVEAMSAVAFVSDTGLFQGARASVVSATDVHPYWWLGAVPADTGLAAETVTTIGEVARAHAEDVTTAAAETLRASGFDVAVAVREGPAAEAIVAEAERWQADLIVVGTRGHGLLKRMLLGSTARSVMHHATASVLITRSLAARESRREHARATDVPTAPRHGEIVLV